MISLGAKSLGGQPPNKVVAIYAGDDPDTRVHVGEVLVRAPYADELIARIAAGEPDITEITPTMARHVLWHFTVPGGYEPGSFMAALIKAIAAADVTHKARLASRYPGLVLAIELAQNTWDGTARLQKIAQGDAPRGDS